MLLHNVCKWVTFSPPGSIILDGEPEWMDLYTESWGIIALVFARKLSPPGVYHSHDPLQPRLPWEKTSQQLSAPRLASSLSVPSFILY